MREEEGAARYMSPLVKQDLAKLEKDGESRRVALLALKQFVENLEPSSVPRFLAQLSESKDTGGSRSYAISLYEEVARVHGKVIIPQIGRVMATVTRSLSASGSSPQLHQACAKVVAALVRYSIDADSSAAEAEDVLKEVSRPLVDLLAGKLEHVAAGAATCMQALVESEKWKHAPADLVSEVCHRTTTALGDKSTRTVAHMQLARSLATMNPGTLNVFGACLLHAAEEVLSASTYAWQYRKCAAKMVQAVLAIVDRETLALEFHAITQVLENCKHDRMPHVRTAVCEALQTAKTFMNGETIKEEDDEDLQGSMSLDPTRESPHQKILSSNKYSPSSQDTYNLSSYTPPPTVSDSATSDPFSTPQFGSTGRMKRSLLFASKTGNYSPTAALTSYHESAGLSSYHDSRSAKEIAQSSVPGGNAIESCGGVSGYHDSALLCLSKAVCDKETDGLQQSDKESPDLKDFTPETVTQEHPKGKVESRFSPFEALITRSFGEAEGDLMAEDEEILSRGTAELGVCGKSRANLRGNFKFSNAVGQFRPESQTPESVVADSECVQSNSIPCRGMDSAHSDANDSALPIKKVFGRNCMTEKIVDVLENKRISRTGSLQGLPPGKPNVHADCDAGISHAQYMKLANLSNNPEDGFSALKPRVLITTADFLPYTTPRRLVLSLQSQLSSPGNEGDEVSNEDAVRRFDDQAGKRAECSERRFDDGTGKRIDFNEEADMDVESSSDSGWSVRDNPVASDESATEDSEGEMEERHTEIYETFARPRKVQTGVRKAVSPPRQFLDRDEDSDHSRNPEEGSTLQIPKPPRTPERSPAADIACSSCTESQRRRSAMKAQEWNLGMDVNRAADDHRSGTRRSMLFEEEADVSSETSQRSKSSIDDAVWVSDCEQRSWWSNVSLVRSCSRISSIAEAVLGGSLCVVIAVPVTMVLARVLQTPQDYLLVPT